LVELTKEQERQLDDYKIKKVWKTPLKAKDMADMYFLVGVLFAGFIIMGVFLVALEIINDGMSFGDYQQMILDYSDCHSMKLMLSNENLGQFHDRLFTQWMVNCG